MLVGSKDQQAPTDGSAAVAESLGAPQEPPKGVVANAASSRNQQEVTDANSLPEPQEKRAQTKDVKGPSSVEHSAGESGTITLHLLPCTCCLSQERLHTALPFLVCSALPCPVTETKRNYTLCLCCNMRTRMAPTMHDTCFEDAKAEDTYVDVELKVPSELRNGKARSLLSRWKQCQATFFAICHLHNPGFESSQASRLFTFPSVLIPQDVMWTLDLT